MKNIRDGVFETNSSSTHSIVIRKSPTGLMQSMYVDEDDNSVTVHPGKFGWEWETYTQPGSKASYAYTFAQTYGKERRIEYMRMLCEVIREQTGAKVVRFIKWNEESAYWKYGYIDHQSDYVALPVFESKEMLRDFIFSPDSVLETGNDNDGPDYY